MASEDVIDDLIEYYVNLLIIQYASGNQPKAQATIALLASQLIASGIFFDVMNAYNIVPTSTDHWDEGGSWDDGQSWDGAQDTAVGIQLDVLGKYVGVNRFYTNINLINYFALVPYSEYASLPSSPPEFGCSTYATFNKFSYNGTLLYEDVITSENSLSDTDFLTLIQFMILCNNMNYSAAAIDNALFNIFGTSFRAESNGNMSMTFFVVGAVSTLINTIIFKGLLPAPEAVGINLVKNIGQLIFGMTTYAQAQQGIFSQYAYGFSTYSDYATLPIQQTLTYENVFPQN